MSKRRIVTLFSGGIDSMVMTEEALQRGDLAATLFVYYGQANCDAEARAVGRWHDFHGNEVPRRWVTSTKLWGLGEMNAPPKARGPRIVPARNLVLISLAVNLAASIGATEVQLGATADDQEMYADCRQSFAKMLSDITVPLFDVAVVFPFASLTKRQVAERGVRIGVPLEHAWSCYAPAPPNWEPCGKCDACILRQKATAALWGQQ